MGGNDFGESNCLFLLKHISIDIFFEFQIRLHFVIEYNTLLSSICLLCMIYRLIVTIVTRARFAYNLHLLEARCLASY